MSYKNLNNSNHFINTVEIKFFKDFQKYPVNKNNIETKYTKELSDKHILKIFQIS